MKPLMPVSDQRRRRGVRSAPLALRRRDLRSPARGFEKFSCAFKRASVRAAPSLLVFTLSCFLLCASAGADSPTPSADVDVPEAVCAPYNRVLEQDLLKKLSALQDGEASIEEFADAVVSFSYGQLRLPHAVLEAIQSSTDVRQILFPVLRAALLPCLARQEADSLLTAARLIYPRTAAEGQEVELLVTSSRSVFDKLALGDRSGAAQVMNTARTPEQVQMLRQAMKYQYSDAEITALKAGDSRQSLVLLARRIQRVKDPATLAAARGVLDSLLSELAAGRPLGIQSQLVLPEVDELFSLLIVRDPTLRDSIAQLYESAVMELVQQNADSGYLDTYMRLLRYRPDPDPKNDRLRIKILYAAKSGDARLFAKGRLEELQRGKKLATSDKIRLLFRGYYGTPVLVTVIFALVSFLALVAVVTVRPELVLRLFRRDEEQDDDDEAEKIAMTGPLRFRQSGVQRAVKKTGDDWDDDDSIKRREPPKFFSKEPRRGYERTEVGDDEYSRLLGVFGLDDGASEADIKKAYREMVKEYHPDAQVGKGTPREDAEAFFIEIKETYDRILQIRSSWFGGAK